MGKMKILKHTLILAIGLCILPSLWAQTPLGKWKTIDDVEKRAKSILEIYEVNGKLHGKILKVFPDPGEDPDPVCDMCPGDKKGKKMVGMEIMWDLEKDGDTWEGGKIMDPENGKVYDCYIELAKADKLKVRGYIGFSLLGRTQYWYRE